MIFNNFVIKINYIILCIKYYIMNTKLTKELFKQVKTLREQGLSFCKISEIVHIDRNIIST